jgi:hypothetical protein
MPESMLTWALRYRAHAWSPIPFLKGRKKPAFKKGVIARYRKTPASSAQLREWFEHTDHQVGFITGAYPYPLVLDIDGDEGRQSIKGLPMPVTPQVETYRGYHAYFRTKTPIHTRINALPGVDILGLNWQVLAPPSLHPNGHRYHFHDLLKLTDVELVEPPTWISDLAQSTRPVSLTPAATTPEDHEDGHPQKNQDTEDGRARDILDTRTTSNSLTPHAVRALFASDAANRALADFLDLPELGRSFLCFWHPESEPSMSLYADTHTGAWKVRDWHGRGEYLDYGLADIFASRLLGREVRLEGKPTLTAWWLRALLACKYLDPAEVPRKPLPLDVRPAVKTVYEGFILLLQAKWRYDPGQSTQFTVRFAMSWCGISSSQTIQEAMWWLVRYGYIRQVKREKGSWTYLPGEGEA